MIVKVRGSGRKNMSLSRVRAKPLMDDPSNQRPSASTAGNCSIGTVTAFALPMMSVQFQIDEAHAARFRFRCQIAHFHVAARFCR